MRGRLDCPDLALSAATRPRDTCTCSTTWLPQQRQRAFPAPPRAHPLSPSCPVAQRALRTLIAAFASDVVCMLPLQVAMSSKSPSLAPAPAQNSPLLGPSVMAPATVMPGSFSTVPVVSPQGSFVATSVCRLLHAPAIATVLAGVASVMLADVSGPNRGRTAYSVTPTRRCPCRAPSRRYQWCRTKPLSWQHRCNRCAKSHTLLTCNRTSACNSRCCDACRRVGSESRTDSLLSHAYAQAPMISMQPVRQVSMTNVNGPTVTPTVVMSPVPVQPVQQIVKVHCTPCTAVFQLAACVRAECALSITKPANKQKFRQKVRTSPQHLCCANPVDAYASIHIFTYT